MSVLCSRVSYFGAHIHTYIYTYLYFYDFMYAHMYILTCEQYFSRSVNDRCCGTLKTLRLRLLFAVVLAVTVSADVNAKSEAVYAVFSILCSN